MLRDTRAVIFDLDDTLYPLAGFVLSGFDAVACHLQKMFDVDRERVRTVLRQSFFSHRGQELQMCARHFGLPESLVPSFVEVIRRHQPTIALPASASGALRSLAPTWRIGIVTNGAEDIQARKIAALGLADRVDAIVIADGLSRAAKPAAAPFLEATRRLQVPISRSVFVGNDPVRDVFGAWRVGMKTIHVAGDPAALPAHVADASVRSLVEVPDIAERLVA